MLFHFTSLLATIAAVTAYPQAADPIDQGPISGPFLPNGTGPGECTPEYRLAGAQQIIFAYNRVQPGESAAAFQRLPLRDDCKVTILANGLPGVPVAIDRTTTVDFATASREAFSRVTGIYKDFPENGTTVINTNVTLGVLHAVALPVTFNADVYLDYDVSQCLMTAIRAYARVPTQVGGVVIGDLVMDTLLSFSSIGE
ncbi:uncharacterized protein RCC_11192 [Ramularia collo-cygni]|uniref:Uncharacterized protein n=1 Tax=Ramularia collo-cygni TaxID=112498 RepID=A0A2D3VE97_9PEZI|nr:uncharacterized protein RCC_11192 [Ramularia collo-cygni]CZT25460.1 uncharacterized protein RCC_11192 [Ramularia collo-cygni]